MALSLLIDENISPLVAEQVRAKRPDINVRSVHEWHEGAYLGVPDDAVLTAAYAEGLSLVTFDTQILSDLAFLFETGIPFAGLIFVDDKTIANADFGTLVRALIYLWDQEHTADWNNRLIFLPAPQE